jgi:hypothetical protein
VHTMQPARRRPQSAYARTTPSTVYARTPPKRPVAPPARGGWLELTKPNVTGELPLYKAMDPYAAVYVGGPNRWQSTAAVRPPGTRPKPTPKRPQSAAVRLTSASRTSTAPPAKMHPHYMTECAFFRQSRTPTASADHLCRLRGRCQGIPALGDRP